jgi:serine/threonine protein kinase
MNFRQLLEPLEQIPPAEVVVARSLGRGRNKTIELGRFRRADVALLRLSDARRNSQPGKAPSDTLENELSIMMHLVSQPDSSMYVPDVLGAVFELRSALLVQEFAVWGDLKDALGNANFRARVTSTHYVNCAAQIAQAMGFLARSGVVHADLAAKNVLLCHFSDDASSSGIQAKVTDFGLSLLLQDSDSVEAQQPVATRWAAPETIASYRYSSRSDVWALGCTLWETYAGGATPWKSIDSRNEVRDRLQSLHAMVERDQVYGNATRIVAASFQASRLCKAEVHELILSALEADEFRRPTADSLAEALLATLHASNSPSEKIASAQLPLESTEVSFGSPSPGSSTEVYALARGQSFTTSASMPTTEAAEPLGETSRFSTPPARASFLQDAPRSAVASTARPETPRLQQQLGLNRGHVQSPIQPKSEQQVILERLQALERQVASLQSANAEHVQERKKETTEKRQRLEKEIDSLRGVNQDLLDSLESLRETLGNENDCSNERSEMDAKSFERLAATLRSRLTDVEKMEAENAAMRAEIEQLKAAESRPRGLQCMNLFRPRA